MGIRTEIDLRKVNSATLDVNLRPFSIWCWEGLCRKVGRADCAPLIFCECECHKNDEG